MTVQELINMLKKFPKDSKINLETEYNTYFDVTVDAGQGFIIIQGLEGSEF